MSVDVGLTVFVCVTVGASCGSDDSGLHATLAALIIMVCPLPPALYMSVSSAPHWPGLYRTLPVPESSVCIFPRRADMQNGC